MMLIIILLKGVLITNIHQYSFQIKIIYHFTDIMFSQQKFWSYLGHKSERLRHIKQEQL